MHPIIQTDRLSKCFVVGKRDIHAVREVSLDIQPGELFGLFGSNGAGKSTLVRMLTTLLAPTSGSARVNGWDVLRNGINVRSSIGLVTADERSFYGRLSARQNLRFYAALQHVPSREIDARISNVLALFDLQTKSDVPFQSLSTGQKQRLNMARALVALWAPALLYFVLQRYLVQGLVASGLKG